MTELNSFDALEHDIRAKNTISFSAALDALKSNMYVTREGWNGKGMWLGLQRPDANSKMSLPYIFMCTADGDLVPWLASQTDLLSDDWLVLDLPY